MSEYIFEINGLEKSFGDHAVLSGIDLKIKKGEVIRKLPEDQLLEALRQELDHWNDQEV